jgi:hypothetical protein
MTRPIDIPIRIIEERIDITGRIAKAPNPNTDYHNTRWELSAYPFGAPSSRESVTSELNVHTAVALQTISRITSIDDLQEPLQGLVPEVDRDPHLQLSDAIKRVQYGRLFPEGFPVRKDPKEFLPEFFIAEIGSALLLSPTSKSSRTIQAAMRGKTRTEEYETLVKAEWFQREMQTAATQAQPAPEWLRPSTPITPTKLSDIGVVFAKFESGSGASEVPLLILQKQFVKKETKSKSLIAAAVEQQRAEAGSWLSASSGTDTEQENPEEEWNVPSKFLGAAPDQLPTRAPSPSVYSRDISGESIPGSEASV